MSTHPEIDPGGLYSFAEARRLLPSPQAGKAGVCLLTLHRWRKAGLFRAELRWIGRRRFWFVWGSELLRLLPSQPPPPPEPLPRVPTEAEKQRRYRRAMEVLERL